MKIMWIIREAQGGMLSHLSQLLAGMADHDLVIVAPKSLQEWAGERPFFPVEIGDRINPRQDFGVVRQLRALLSNHRPDVVHIHGLKAALVTVMASTLLRSRPRLVFTLHNNLPLPGNLFRRTAYTLVHRRLFRKLDFIITVSDAMRDQLVAYTSPNRIITIRNGIPVDRFGQCPKTQARELMKLPSSARVVGLVARLISSKGISTAIKAASLLTKLIPDLHMVIVGEGPERATFEHYAAALSLSDRVHFLGWRSDVPELMAGWDLFILPSLSEGFSVSVLEAMAAKLPVVVSDLACMREAVVPKKGGYLVKPGDAPELAAAILNILKDPRRAEQMGEFNRQRAVALFGHERMIECTRAVYEGLSQT